MTASYSIGRRSTPAAEASLPTPACSGSTESSIGSRGCRGRAAVWSTGPGRAGRLLEAVRGLLDWDRRLDLMRTHTALHILCGVVWRDFGAQVTGGDMKPLSARMDFELEHMTADFAHDVEELINAEVAAARPVKARTLPREEAFQIPDLIRTKINLLPASIEEVRTVEIVGLDLQADGGIHVATPARSDTLEWSSTRARGGSTSASGSR